jgi:sugar/nucleoside kinase (ribokinase family)
LILVFGTICLDRIRRIEQLPKKGGYCEIQDQLELLGGEAANTASFLAMWRVDVHLAGNSLGSGYEGDNLRLRLLERGLDDVYLSRAGKTPICDVYVTEDGDRTMFGLGFSGMSLSSPLDQLPLEKDKWFTAEPNMDTQSRLAVKQAHKAGMKLYLMDFFRPDEEIPPGAICQFGTDWVGERDNPEVNMQWVADWSAIHKCVTILTDGKNGIFVAEHGKVATHLPAFPIFNVVDTTGAGDAFRAGVLYGLSHEWSLSHALRFGSAAAALKVQHIGATEHIPSLREVEIFIEENPEISARFDRQLSRR